MWNPPLPLYLYHVSSFIVHWWKHRYTSECMHSVYDQAFGAKMPTYQMVLQLDRKLRGFHVPAILQIAGFGNADTRSSYDSVPLILQRHLVLAIRESSACAYRYVSVCASADRSGLGQIYSVSPIYIGGLVIRQG